MAGLKTSVRAKAPGDQRILPAVWTGRVGPVAGVWHPGAPTGLRKITVLRKAAFLRCADKWPTPACPRACFLRCLEKGAAQDF